MNHDIEIPPSQKAIFERMPGFVSAADYAQRVPQRGEFGAIEDFFIFTRIGAPPSSLTDLSLLRRYSRNLRAERSAYTSASSSVRLFRVAHNVCAACGYALGFCLCGNPFWMVNFGRIMGWYRSQPDHDVPIQLADKRARQCFWCKEPLDHPPNDCPLSGIKLSVNNSRPANPVITEALARGEDTTGLCTVRDFAQAVVESRTMAMFTDQGFCSVKNPGPFTIIVPWAEMTFIHKGKRYSVEMAITKMEDAQ